MEKDQSESLKAIGAELLFQSKKISKFADNLNSALADGDLGLALKSSGELTELASALQVNTSRAIDELKQYSQSVGGVNELREMALKRAKEVFPSHPVFISEGSLIVHPVVVKFEQSKEEIRVQVEGATFSTVSSERIMELVGASLKNNFDAAKFLRSVYHSYKAICALTGRTSIPLEDVRQVLSVTRDSTNSYTRDSFEADLQRWNSSDVKDVSGKRAHLEHVAAARDGYLIVSVTGARTKLSNISFVE